MIRTTLAAVAAAALLAPFAAAETPDTQNVEQPAVQGPAAPVVETPVAPPAVTEAGPPAGAAQAPGAPSAYTDAQLQAFAEASVEIEAIKSQADANGGLNAESTAAIRDSLASHQLTLESYNAIVASLQTDTVLAERVAALRAQAATTESAG